MERGDWNVYKSLKEYFWKEISMQKKSGDEIRQAVRINYGKVAKNGSAGCACSPSSGCGTGSVPTPDAIAERIGYSQSELSMLPEGANMGLGCGNPLAIASLKQGETVLDLGCGGGLDCFLAAKAVGEGGYVIGIDMTPEMVEKARQNAARAGIENVDFRLGEIEHLPVADNSIDVIISNCVINLSPEKDKVFQDAYRVLKSGGRLSVSDIVSMSTMPSEVKEDLALHSACIAGASSVEELERMLQDAGFRNISIEANYKSREFIKEWAPGSKAEDYIVSAIIRAKKP
jgi:SAM-dependent methyltransferase